MTKQFRNIFLALIVTANFSSCSYHYFYPQRVDIYGFDSSGQTKGIVEPYFNMLNLHLGIAHSFSDHIFTSVGIQGDTKIISLFDGQLNKTSKGWLGNFSVGYFGKSQNGTGFEIVPGISFEKNDAKISNYFFGGWEYGNWEQKVHAEYVVPSIQTSFYKRGINSNFYSSIRFSYLFSHVTFLPRNQFYNSPAPEMRITFPKTFLIEPAIQFSFKHSKTMRYFISMHIGNNKVDYFDLIPPFQAGFKFMIE